MIRRFFFLALICFLSLNTFAAQPRSSPLPVFSESQINEIISKKQFMEEHKKIHPIEWSLNWHTGVQQITMTELPTVPGIYVDMAEVIFTSNRYKGAVLSVDIQPLFTIYSNLSIGFTKGNFPRDFSIDNIPYQYAHLSALESESYAAKKISLKHNLSIAPYAGYTFSQYKLKPLQPGIAEQARDYHSVVVGNKFIFQPHRIFFIEASISFSPFTAIDSNLLTMFQINYETNFTFTTDIFTFSLLLSTRNNIEYKGSNPEARTLKISKTGFRFRFSI